jgi:dienelactone hydrolase
MRSTSANDFPSRAAHKRPLACAQFRIAAAITLLIAGLHSMAQTSLPHSFDKIAASSNGTISLTLTGRVATVFRPYFDLYPIEVSNDLVTWSPLITLIRTNASAAALTYAETNFPQISTWFFRTVTNRLTVPSVKPTGPYAVGKISRLISDPTRTNRYNVRTNSSFMVSYWYPAQAQAGDLPGPFREKQLAQDPAYADAYTDRIPGFVAHSLPSAKLSPDRPTYPVIIYSHGWGLNRASNDDKCEVLASHGYIVASPDHIDAVGTVFPDGRYLHGTGESGIADRSAFLGRVQDLRVVLADLEQMNAGDSILAGHIDISNVGSFGFSFGAGAAAELCRTENQCRASLVLAATWQGADELVKGGLQKPLMTMSNPTNPNSPIFDKATQDAIWLLLSDTVHNSFSAEHLIVDTSISNREATRTINVYLVSFFNKYLKGQDDHLLDGASTNFPRVTNFKRK